MRAYGQVGASRIKQSLFQLVILLLMFLISDESGAAGAPRRVLILHSYNYTFPANAAISDSLRKELGRSSQPLEIEADFLDLARRPDDAHALKTANFLREKYANVRFDAVVVVGIPAMPFLLKFRDMIAPGVPVVWSDVTSATFDATKVPADITAVINNYKPERTIELAERLQPDARRFVVIAGTSSVDRRWQENGRRAVEAHNSSKLEAEYCLTAHTTNCWKMFPNCRAIQLSCFLRSSPTAKTARLYLKMWLWQLRGPPLLRSMASSTPI